MSETTSTVETVNANGFLSVEKQAKLKSFSFWLKFYAVVLFVGAGFMIIPGILLLLILVGVFYIAFGVLFIFMGLQLWRAAQAAEAILENNTQDNYQDKSFEALSNVSTYFKIIGIIVIVHLVLLLVALLFLIIAFIVGAISAEDLSSLIVPVLP
jgi:uncharacterized membrane protein YkgB